MENETRLDELKGDRPENIDASRCDLHTHTQASDGMQPPEENVRLAKEKGLIAVAITDHDTVAGVKEARSRREVRNHCCTGCRDQHSCWRKRYSRPWILHRSSK